MEQYINKNHVIKNIANLSQLVFEVTDACNLNCRYCAYGEFYDNYDLREKKKLSVQKAKKLIDYLNKFWTSNYNLSSNSIMYISFYGGEPLLNFKFIEEIVSYVKNIQKHSSRNFIFSMTTNAILLNQYIDYLVENKFHILISLDGNKFNNSYRVDHKNNDCFEIIVKNVDSIQKKYPDYFKRNINFNSVLHNRNSYDDIYTFFKTRYDKLPNISELNTIGIRTEKVKDFYKIYKNTETSLRQSKHSEEIENELFLGTDNYKNLALYLQKYSGNYFDDYTDLLFGNECNRTVPTGTCLPFSRKMYVSVNGKILPCERIGHQFALGEIKNTNIVLDAESIANKYNKYISKLKDQCSNCKLFKMCSQCIFNIQNIDERNPVCFGFMNDSMMNSYRFKLMRFLTLHPEAYQKILNDVTTL